MALVVEDGSEVAGANSYVTLVEARAFLDARALLPSATVDDTALTLLLVKATDYLQSKQSKFKGTRVTSTQPLAWPREDAYIYPEDESPFASDEIPQQLKDAQCLAAVEINTYDLMPSGRGREVTEETVGPLTTAYAPGSGTVGTPIPTKVLAALAPLLSTTSALTVRRT